MAERYHIDWEAFHHQAQTGPCFLCEIAMGNPDYPAHIVYEDAVMLAVLDKYPSLPGHTLVTRRAHYEQVTGDLSIDEYVEVQRLVYTVTEALRHEVPNDRIYIFTLGSNQGNAHVHWHIVPLPPGVPYHQQQFAALRRSEHGIYPMSNDDLADLAQRLRHRIGAS